MPKKSNRNEFIEKANQIHNNKYDYSKVEYVNNHTKVCIICPDHGEFWQTPHGHLAGYGCKECGYNIVKGKESISLEEFISRSNETHNFKYDYSQVKLNGVHNKVDIICPKHGIFSQTAISHFRGYGCPRCASEASSVRYALGKDEFMKRANKIHNNKYDYSNVTYVNMYTLVDIVCPIHGTFQQKPNTHLRGQGCKECGKLKGIQSRTKTTKSFIERAQKIHGDRYDYSKVDYKKEKEKVCIICPEHGEFWQTPSNHLSGYGCNMCKTSHLETDTRKILIENSCGNFIQNIHPAFLDKLELDFYFQDKNIAIECQGEQHFSENHFFQSLQETLSRDQRKYQRCIDNGIKLLYISSRKFDVDYQDPIYGGIYNDDNVLFIEDIEKDNSILLNKIKEL